MNELSNLLENFYNEKYYYHEKICIKIDKFILRSTLIISTVLLFILTCYLWFYPIILGLHPDIANFTVFFIIYCIILRFYSLYIEDKIYFIIYKLIYRRNITFKNQHKNISVYHMTYFIE